MNLSSDERTPFPLDDSEWRAAITSAWSGGRQFGLAERQTFAHFAVVFRLATAAGRWTKQHNSGPDVAAEEPVIETYPVRESRPLTPPPFSGRPSFGPPPPGQ
ncbi:MAG TPA: hypothetical protein VHE61_07290 [Opitutaceae bacterium]|nr:hypothetical protein [Opitutaceae bacterium]